MDPPEFPPDPPDQIITLYHVSVESLKPEKDKLVALCESVFSVEDLLVSQHKELQDVVDKHNGIEEERVDMSSRLSTLSSKSSEDTRYAEEAMSNIKDILESDYVPDDHLTGQALAIELARFGSMNQARNINEDVKAVLFNHELEVMRRSRDGLQSHVDALKCKVEHHETDTEAINQLRLELSTNATQIQNLTTTKEGLDRELEKHKSGAVLHSQQMREKEAECKAMQNRIDDKTKIIRNLKGEAVESDSRLALAETEIYKLTRSLKRSKDSEKTRDEMIKRRADRIKTLNEELETERFYRQAAEEDKLTSQQVHDERAEEDQKLLTKKSEDVRLLKENMATDKAIFEKLVSDHAEALKTQKTQLEEDYKADLDKEKTSLRKELDEGYATTLASEKAALEKQLAETHAANVVAERKILTEQLDQAHTTNLENAKRDLNSRLAQQHIVSLEKAKKDLREELGKEHIANVATEKKTLTEQLDEAHATNLENEKRALENRLAEQHTASLEKAKKDLRGELDKEHAANVEKEKNSLKDQLDEAHATNLASEKQALQDQLKTDHAATLRKQMDNLTREIDTVHIANVEEEKKSLKAQLDEAHATNLVIEKKSLKDQLDKTYATNLATEKDTLRNQFETSHAAILKKQTEDLTSNLNTAHTANLSEEKRVLRDQLNGEYQKAQEQALLSAKESILADAEKVRQKLVLRHDEKEKALKKESARHETIAIARSQDLDMCVSNMTLCLRGLVSGLRSIPQEPCQRLSSIVLFNNPKVIVVDLAKTVDAIPWELDVRTPKSVAYQDKDTDLRASIMRLYGLLHLPSPTRDTFLLINKISIYLSRCTDSAVPQMISECLVVYVKVINRLQLVHVGSAFLGIALSFLIKRTISRFPILQIGETSSELTELLAKVTMYIQNCHEVVGIAFEAMKGDESTIGERLAEATGLDVCRHRQASDHYLVSMPKSNWMVVILVNQHMRKVGLISKALVKREDDPPLLDATIYSIEGRNGLPTCKFTIPLNQGLEELRWWARNIQSHHGEGLDSVDILLERLRNGEDIFEGLL